MSHFFSSFLDQLEIFHQTTCPDTPGQNGVAERKNRLLEVSRTLLFTINVPKTFWFDAVQTTAFLINRMPTRVLGFKTPIDVMSLPITLFPIPPRVLGVFVMCTLTNSRGPNLILNLSNASSWGMLLVRRVICVTTLLLGSGLCLWILYFMRQFLLSSQPSTRGDLSTVGSPSKPFLVPFFIFDLGASDEG